MLFYVLVLLCLILLFKLWSDNSDYWKKRNIVQEDDVLFKFLRRNIAIGEIYKEIYDKHRNEKHIGTFLGTKPALIIKDPVNIKTVFAGDFQSFHSRGAFINPNDILANNILFMDDYKKWKLIRQKLSPIFTTFKLKTLFYLIERCARDFPRFIEDSQNMKKEPFLALYTYTTASLGTSIFGIDPNTNSTMNTPFFKMAWETSAPSFKANLRFFLTGMFPKLCLLLNIKIFGDFEDYFVNIVKNVLKSRKGTTEKRYDFIETCAALQETGLMHDHETGFSLYLTDEVIAAQAFFFFLAGIDTSANAMHFTLIELAHNSDILKKVHDEIDEVFNECDEKISYDAVEKLKYFDKVLNESLRKYPPIGALQRKCTRDTTLPIGNVKVEKDTLVVIPVYAIHRDEKYYSNPEVFDPERFKSKDVESRLNYFPFGDGNRFCLGARYARLQVKIGLAWLLRRFTLKPLEKPPLTFEKSLFGIKATTKNYYDLIQRNI